jgi:homoserine O-acetyltransferase
MLSAPYDFSRSVGLVQTKTLRLDLPPEGFRLESGETLPEIQVAYETYGTLAPNRRNVIYICHALSGDAHAAGFHTEEEMRAPRPKPGWWDIMIGPGKPIDTNRFFVVCTNNLGGCKGTTGPSSVDPRTGRPYGSRFPRITVGDMVEVQYRFLKALGIEHLAAVMGGSMGGMQVLEWAIRFPEAMDRCLCIASAASLSAQALAFNILGRRIIMSDPDWQGGDYYESGRRPDMGLALARMMAHITYLSPSMMEEKFGRDKRSDVSARRFYTPFQVESYLDHQGNQFIRRFDANSYLHITEAMDAYDLEERFGSLEAAFRNVKARFLVVALTTDWLFPPEQSRELAQALLRAGCDTTYALLEAEQGHDAFLLDFPELSDLIREYLLASPAAAAPPASLPSTDSEFALIRQLVPSGARILDLGCGDGTLLSGLTAGTGRPGLGVEINTRRVIETVARGVPVLQLDMDEGLDMLPDGAFDVAVLSRTLQVVRKPADVLREMLRLAKTAIVTFPNFGHWKHRVRLGLLGRMPKSEDLPFEWYNTPNIHLTTLVDFLALCQKEGWRCTQLHCIGRDRLSRALIALGFRNSGADEVVAVLERA